MNSSFPSNPDDFPHSVLNQKPRTVSLIATSIAASIECFYRSAMNCILNSRLSDTPINFKTLFPNIFVQLPTRILYVSGIKAIRHYIEYSDQFEELHENLNKNNQLPISISWIKFGYAVSPGLIMTPVSSILEASNATTNTEPLLTKRWTRGFIPRSIREVIFGIGLNQLSDFYQTRIPYFKESPYLKTATGSMIAGAVSGYFSQFVHNLSALKLLDPSKAYWIHFQEMTSKVNLTFPPQISTKYHPYLKGLIVIVFPRGTIIRTTQIIGSFMILNGIIHIIESEFDTASIQNKISSLFSK